MFCLHAVYGLGATVSPFVATAFVQKVTERFYLYFAISLALAGTTVTTLILTFQGRTEDQVVGKRKPAVEVPPVPVPDVGGAMEGEREAMRDGRTGEGEQGTEEAVQEREEDTRDGSAKLKAILSMPRSYYLAFYIFLYVSRMGDAGAQKD